MRHVLSLLELEKNEITNLLAQAAELKAQCQSGDRKLTLMGRVLGMIFEKPSMRTRVSFQTAMAQLGGASVFLSSSEVGLGSRESIPDFSRVMSQYVDAVVLRTFQHATVETFAEYSTCPVINGLSDYYHPCQALGDLLTMKEVFGDVRGKTLVFVGDGNNVARSLAICCGKLDVRFTLSAPKDYGFDDAFCQLYRKQHFKYRFSHECDPAKAVQSADVIYTDVWASMGQEDEREQRRTDFADYQVNEQLVSQAPRQVRLMHCLPAHRGEEITSDMLDSDRSIVIQQAGNRLHAQKALLQWLLT